MALVAGAVALAVLAGVVLATVRTGDRPEEDVAAAFVSALLAGEVDAAYELTTPGYRLVVRPSDLAVLAAALRDVAGDDPDPEILGSERTPGTAPAESLVGYTARTDAGRMEGVVTLLRPDAASDWLVHDLSFRFPDADPDQLATLRRVSRQLNEALAERVEAGTEPSSAG